MVSTDKLDEMINEMIDNNSKTVKRTTGGKFADEVLKTSNGETVKILQVRH